VYITPPVLPIVHRLVCLWTQSVTPLLRILCVYALLITHTPADNLCLRITLIQRGTTLPFPFITLTPPCLPLFILTTLCADYLGFRIARYKFEAAKSSDLRLSSLQEILMAIKLVKFYVWESSFEEQVSEVRTPVCYVHVCLCVMHQTLVGN